MPTQTSASRTSILPSASSRYIRFLQIAWLIMTPLTALMYLVALPYALSTREAFALQVFGQALPSFGMTPTGYADYFSALESLYVLMSFIMGVLLFSLRPNEKVALVTALALVTFSATVGPSSEALALNSPAWASLVMIVTAVGLVSMLMFLWQFPNGRYVPSWSRWLALLIVPLSLYFAYADAYITDDNDWLSGVFIVASLLAASAAQVWRYRKIATPQERQQTKLIVFGFAFGLLPVTLFVVGDIFISPRLADQPTLRLAYRLFVNLFMIYLPFSLFPLSIGLAILRYRLWNIDLVVNRALVGLLRVAIQAFAGIAVALLAHPLLPAPLPLLLGLLAALALTVPTARAVRHLVDRNLYGFRFDLRDLRAAARAKPEIQEAGQYSGRVIGGFELLGVIGRGGMGEIYKAYHPQQPLRAMKILLPQMGGPGDHEARFLREARLGQHFDHPRLVRVWDHGQQDGLSYLLMDYIEGQDLRQCLAERGKLSLEDSLDLARQVAEALHVVHQQGIVHRDVKPANIFLTLPEGQEIAQVVLMDFGVARLSGEQAGLALADPQLNAEVTGSAAVGTIHYMAPEQILESRAVDHRADIYAMAVVLYEMLAGQRPFQGDAAQVLFDHLNKPAPDLRKVLPEAPSSLAKAILKALAKAPEDRFQTMHDFEQALSAVTVPGAG
jgi:hypothetical protein